MQSICTSLEESYLEHGNSLESSNLKDIKHKYLYEIQHDTCYSKFAHVSNDVLNEFYKVKVLKQNSTKHVEQNMYTKNIGNALEYFSNKLCGMNIEDKELLLKKLTKQLKFNEYIIDKEFNVYITFETMNNRGKPLSKLEILKNRLIYLSNFLPCFDNLNKDALNEYYTFIAKSWQTIYSELGSSEKFLFNDDLFLKDHTIIYFGYSQGKKYEDYLLNEHFQPNKLELKIADIKKYVESLVSCVYYWVISYYQRDLDIKIPEEYSKQEQKELDAINRQGMYYFRPLIVCLLQKKEIESSIRSNIFKEIEKLIFLNFQFAHYGSSYQINYFGKIAHEIYKANSLIDDKIDELCLEIENKIQEHRHRRTKDFIGHITKLPNLFYGWKALKYFLYEYYR